MTRLLPLPREDEVLLGFDHEEAGFGALRTDRGCLPLKAMDVQGRIDGLLSQVTLRQTFVNATDEPLEATYIFPLPDRAAVTSFQMEVNDRVIDGVLHERSQARREYAEAITEGRRASIAEEERPGVFTLRAGNLMPGDVATVRFTMTGTLPDSDGEVTFRFPLVVAPRYVPGVPLPGSSVGDGVALDTDAVPDASRISPPVLLPGFPNPVRLSMTIDLHETSAAAEDVRVSLHVVCEERLDGLRRITLTPGDRLDRDFILRFRLGDEAIRSSLSLHPDATDSREGTFALTVIPPGDLEGHAQRPRDIVFVLDRSGSMSGWKMVAARRAMARLVDTLNDRDRFTIFAFDDSIETPDSRDDSLAQANHRNRFRADQFLAKIDSRGGTQMARPLDKAVRLLGDATPGRERILVLVTDGQVGNEDQVLRTLAPRISGIRVFTLGIDQAVNEGFLHRLAELGGGSCELVESEGRLDAVMESVHRRIGTPVLTDLSLVPGGVEVVSESLVPERAPCLFAGSPLLLLGRYRGYPGGAVVLRAEAANGDAWHEAVAPSVRDNPAITSAWARGQVHKLEDRFASGIGDHAALERTIVETSIRFGVLCRFTAYVAIDRSSVVNPGGDVHQVTQPVETPAGWAASAKPLDALLSTMHHRLNSIRASREQMLYEVMCDKADDSFAIDEADDTMAMYCLTGPSDSSTASLPAPPLPTIPHSTESLRRANFVSVEEVGQDVHGTIYKAHDPSGRLVTIRVLDQPSGLVGKPDALLAHERLLARLVHRSIVPIMRVIEAAGQILVVSRYVAGTALSNRLGQNGPFGPHKAARLILALAEALRYAHQRGVLHGDLGIHAVQIGDDGTPRIADLGLIPLQCKPAFLLNTANVAPERLSSSSNGQPTKQADVYSLGVIFYQILTGALPPPISREPRPPRELNAQIPVELEVICQKAIARDPAARYASAEALANDLRTFLGVKGPGLLRRLVDKIKVPPPSQPPAPDTSAPPPPADVTRREGFWK